MTTTVKSSIKTINAFASIKGMEMSGGDFDGKQQRSSTFLADRRSVEGCRESSSDLPRFAYFSIDHIALALGIRQKPLPSAFYDLFDPSEIFLENRLPEKEVKEVKKSDPEAPVLLHGKDAKDHRDGFQKKKFVKVYRSVSEVMGGECFTLFVNPKSNVSISYRFLDSIFTVIYGAMGPENLDSYMMLPSHEKQNLFTEWIKKLISEFVDEQSPTGGAYYAFNYAKHRAMKRENVMLSLNQALQNRCDPKIFHTLIQYTVDMMNISLVIFNMKAPHIDFEKSEVYHYKNIYNPLNPLAILIYDNGIYYPVLRGNQKSPILNWCGSGNSESDGDHQTQSVINKIYKYMKMEDAHLFIKRIAEKKSLDNGLEGSTETRIQNSLWENLRSTADPDLDDSEIDLESHPMETTESLDLLRVFQEERGKMDPIKAAFTSGIFQGVTIENAFPIILSISKPPLKTIKVEKGEKNAEKKVVEKNAEKKVVEKNAEKKVVEKPAIPSKASLEKMLKDQLEELCNQNGVSTQKKSEKTGKMISKTKSEIIADLLAL